MKSNPHPPLHMDPMTPDEVRELLGSTLHGPLPHATVQRMMAILAAALPTPKRQEEFDEAALLGQAAERGRTVCIQRGTHTTHDGYCVECIRIMWRLLGPVGLGAERHGDQRGGKR